MNKTEVAQKIIEEILNQKITMVAEKQSAVNYILTTNGAGTVLKVGQITSFSILPDNSRTKYLISIMSPGTQMLIKTYGWQLFVILHEIGHVKTCAGLNLKLDLQKKEKIAQMSHYLEQAKAYRNLPKERRADKWAANWLLKHPKQAKFYSELLESASDG